MIQARAWPRTSRYHDSTCQSPESCNRVASEQTMNLPCWYAEGPLHTQFTTTERPRSQAKSLQWQRAPFHLRQHPIPICCLAVARKPCLCLNRLQRLSISDLHSHLYPIPNPINRNMNSQKLLPPAISRWHASSQG